jgi:hypothetical protein
MVKTNSGKEGYRSFTITNISNVLNCPTKYRAGRYISRTPIGAAKKAFTEHCRVKDIRGVCTLFVRVRETTQGSSHKEHTYKMERNKLATALVMQEGTENEYEIYYSIDAKSTSILNSTKCNKSNKSPGRMRKKTAKKQKAIKHNK